MEKIVSLLKEKDISPSPQRLAILCYLLENKEHPSADQVHSHLRGSIPSLSKATVYNALKLFEEKGLVFKVPFAEGEARFDALLQPHAHFECRLCGRLLDIPLEKNDISFPVKERFRVEETYLIGRGVCASCNK